MGKRSNFQRIERDYYPTPIDAAAPLFPILSTGTQFFEPCAGNGALVSHLTNAGHNCTAAYDIEPQAPGIEQADMLTTPFPSDGSMLITNPPWARPTLHQLINKMIDERITGWLLFDYSWSATQQAVPMLPNVRMIMPIGRVRWFNGSPHKSKDAAAWHMIAPEPGITQLITPKGYAV